MTTHILSMTYGPKIAGVRDGSIRQTIRRSNPDNPFELGDKLLIHGWSGKPYRSPWNWWIEERVKEFDWLKVDSCCWVLVDHEGYCTALNPWGYEHDVINRIAKADGIVPPTGLGLKAVLEQFHGPFTDEEIEFQVIRW